MNTPVLVLNANYEPINVCRTRRAVILVIVGKAEVVENGRGYVRTPTQFVLRPSVIRLQYMINRPRPHVRLSKQEIFRRDNYTCQYCGKQVKDLTIDHVIPRHLGGQHRWDNLVSACPTCNRRKGGRPLRETDMHLLHTPKEPEAGTNYFFLSSRGEKLFFSPLLDKHLYAGPRIGPYDLNHPSSGCNRP
jgi:5-methylcytosine-specific restriction endonuclease McrA